MYISLLLWIQRGAKQASDSDWMDILKIAGPVGVTAIVVSYIWARVVMAKDLDEVTKAAEERTQLVSLLQSVANTLGKVEGALETFARRQ